MVVSLNAGINAAVSVDLEGVPRSMGAGYDIGSDEHVPALPGAFGKSSTSDGITGQLIVSAK